MKHKALQARLYAYAFFDDLMPIYPLYALMFVDFGLDAAQVSSLLFVWSLTAFVLEVPTGAIADRFPRKYVLVAAQLARGLGYLCWLLFPTYWGFLAGFVLWGIESAFSSGTRQALMFDELKAVGQEKRYTKIAGRYTAVSIVSVGIASLVAAWVAPQNYALLIGLSLASMVVAIAIMASLPSAKHVKDTDELEEVGHIRSGIRELRTNHRALRVVLFASFVLGFGALDEYHSLFFREVGLGNQTIAIWLAGMSVAGIAASLVAHRLSDNAHLQRARSVSVMVAVWGGLLLLASLGGGIMAPLLIMVFTFFFYLIETLTNGWLQHAIKGRSRATITSIQGFATELFALSGFAAVGVMSQLSGFAVAFRVCAVLTIAVALLYWVRSTFAARKRQS